MPPARTLLRSTALRSTALRHGAAAALALVAVVIVTTAVGDYRDLQFAQFGFYLCAVAGLTVVTGQSGQISLGQGAFMAVGAYSDALLSLHQHWPLAVVLVVATLVTAVVGLLVGAAAARLRGPYLAGATLTLAVGLPALTVYHPLVGVLGGSNGLLVPPSAPPSGLGASFTLQHWEAWVCLLCAVVVLVLLANLLRSRVGRSFRAVRDDEVAAALAGLRVARLQVLAFTISAACGGLGGALLAFVDNLAAPGAFGLALSLSLLTAVVLGGLTSLMGAVWGAAALVVLPVWATDIAHSAHLSSQVYANLPLAIYGVVLVVVMILFPEGLQGGLHRLGRLARRSRAGHGAATTRGS